MSGAVYFVCPGCGFTADTTEDVGLHLITYWGEDGPQDWHCPNCDRMFRVTEHVSRTWTFSERE